MYALFFKDKQLSFRMPWFFAVIMFQNYCNVHMYLLGYTIQKIEKGKNK